MHHAEVLVAEAPQLLAEAAPVDEQPLGVRPERLLLEASAGSVVVRVSIVDGAPDEPTAARAAGVLQALHTAGELQQKLAAEGVLDVLDASQPPVLYVAPEADSPSASGGCTYPTAANYDAAAAVDDGSCSWGPRGCTYPTAANYDAAS